jgi:hypothetical protein
MTSPLGHQDAKLEDLLSGVVADGRIQLMVAALRDEVGSRASRDGRIKVNNGERRGEGPPLRNRWQAPVAE